MTVQELRDKLKAHNPDDEVWFDTGLDDEPLYGVSYVTRNTTLHERKPANDETEIPDPSIVVLS